MTITRSPGLPIGYGYICGGGYRGASEALDAVVREAAEVLAEAYGMDVTIRFNSDRRSGGAWLVTDAVDGIGRNAEIGIGGRIVDARTNETLRKYGDEEIAEGVYVHAHIGRRALISPELANATDYYHGTQDSVADALAFVRAHGSLDFLTD